MPEVTLQPAVTFVLPLALLPDMRVVLDRAMNTWEPSAQPSWLAAFSQQVDAALGGQPV